MKTLHNPPSIDSQVAAEYHSYSCLNHREDEHYKFYKAGFSFATDLVFERVVEALRSANMAMLQDTSGNWADWLVANKDKILSTSAPQAGQEE